jgi:8-oxo-dGTP pyrophosphatase MutT (NUDIX family)
MPTPDFILELRAKVGHARLLLPCVTAVIRNDRGEILLQRRSEGGGWGLLSGIVEPGEEPADAVVREVREESGLSVVPERVSGVYGGPDLALRYANGDEATYVDITFVCHPTGAEVPRVNDEESLEIRYFEPSALPLMAAYHRYRLEHSLRGDPRAHFRLNGAP